MVISVIRYMVPIFMLSMIILFYASEMLNEFFIFRHTTDCINGCLVETGLMNVSSSFSEPRYVLDLLPLLFEGLSLFLQVPLGLHLSPGLPGLKGTLLEG